MSSLFCHSYKKQHGIQCDLKSDWKRSLLQVGKMDVRDLRVEMWSSCPWKVCMVSNYYWNRFCVWRATEYFPSQHDRVIGSITSVRKHLYNPLNKIYSTMQSTEVKSVKEGTNVALSLRMNRLTAWAFCSCSWNQKHRKLIRGWFLRANTSHVHYMILFSYYLVFLEVNSKS